MPQAMFDATPMLSRRALLQGAGLGVAGMMLATPPAFAVTPTANNLAFSFKGAAGHTASAVPALAPGSVVAVDAFGKGQRAGSAAYRLSSPDADVVWTFPSTDLDPTTDPLTESGGFATPLVTRDAVYLAGAAHVYCLDLDTGAERWRREYTVASSDDCPFSTLNGGILFRTDGDAVVCLDADGTQRWLRVLEGFPDASALPAGTPAVTADGVVVIAAGYLFVLDEFGLVIHTRQVGAVDPHLTVGVGVVVYRALEDDTTPERLIAIDTATWEPAWTVPTSAKGESFGEPLFSSGLLYVGTSSGEFFALDDGALAWNTTLGGDLSQGRVVVDEGVAYTIGQASGGAKIYAVQLEATSSGAHDHVTADAGFTGAALIGVGSSVCYFSKADRSSRVRINGVDLAGLFSQFYTESQLMAGDYTTTADGPTPSAPTFHTQVLMTHPNKSPRANCAVKVWASEDIDLLVGDSRISVGKNRHHWMTTSGSGELTLTTEATEISSPALYLWSPFMDRGDVMVVYPDQDTLHTMATATGTDLLGLTTFAGTSALPSSYTADQASTLATTVNKTLGDVGSSVAATQALRASGTGRRAVAQTSASVYTAFPDTTNNLVYQALASPVGREYVPTTTTDWSVMIENGIVQHEEGTGLAPLTSTKGSLGGKKTKTFEDFLREVVRKAKKVTHIVWHAAKKAAKEIYDEAGNLYKFAVDTIEKAAAIVSALLHTVMADVKAAVEALCQLFDWSEIVDAATTIRDATKQNISAVAKNLDTTALTSLLTQIKADIAASTGTATSAVTGRSPGSQKGYGDPSTTYGRNGAKSYCSSTWVSGKVADGVGSGSGATLELGGADEDFLAEFTIIFDKIEAALASDLTQIDTAAKSTFTTLHKLVKDPSKYAAAGLDAILQLLLAFVEFLIDATIDIVEIVVDSLPDLITKLLGVLEKDLDIPIISDLFEHFAHEKLNFLNVMCLVIAVPTHIVMAASDDDLDELEYAWHVSNFAYIFAALVYGLGSVGLDLTNSEKDPNDAKAMPILVTAANLVEVGMLVDRSSAAQRATQHFWALQTGQVLMSIMNVWVAYTKLNETRGPFAAQKATAATDCLTAIVCAGLFIDDFAQSDKALSDVMILCDNIVTYLPAPFMYAPIYLPDPGPGPTIQAVADGICDAGQIAFTIAAWEES